MRSSGIITLTTDFGLKDAYVGTMKGVILSIFPQARLVDITHEVEPQNILQARFLLRNFISYFPKGTVHLVVVDPGVGSERRPILVESQGQFLVGPDNGVFTDFFPDSAGIFHLNKSEFFLEKISQTFHGRDIFAPASAHLASGREPEEMGEPITDPVSFPFPKPEKQGNLLLGEVIYIDRFGNLITNLSGEEIPENALIRIVGKEIPGLSKSYAQHSPGTLLAIIGSSGFLEISLANDNASLRLKAGVGQPVEVILPEK